MATIFDLSKSFLENKRRVGTEPTLPRPTFTPVKEEPRGGILGTFERASKGISQFVKSAFFETPLRFAKTAFLEYPARAAAQLTLGVEEELRKGERRTSTPETPIERFFFGQDKIVSIQERVERTKESMEEWGISPKAVGFEIGDVPVAPMALVSAGMFLELTTFGGKKKGLATALQKVNKVEDAFSVLKRAGVADDIARVYAPKFANLKNIGEITKGIGSLENAIKFTKATDPVINLGKKTLPEIAPKLPATLTKVEKKAIEAGLGAADDLAKIRAKTRGVITDVAAKAEARRMGITPESFLNTPIKPLTKEARTAVGGLIQNELDTLRILERQLPMARLDPSIPRNAEIINNYATQKIKTLKLLAKERAHASEAGKALQAEKVVFDAITDQEQRIAKYLADPKALQETKDYILKAIADFKGDPKQMAELLKKMRQASGMEMFVEFATAMKLYAIPTHIVNTVTSFSRMIINTPLRAISATLDKTVGMLWGGKRTRFVAEAMAEAQGQFMGFKNMHYHIGRALTDEQYALSLRKASDFYGGHAPAIKGRLGKSGLWDNFLDFVGPKIRSSFRMLGVEDVLIRRPTESGTLYTLAARDALSKGMKFGSKEYNNHIAKLVLDPTMDMLNMAKIDGHTTLFQRDLPETLAIFNRMRNEAPATKLVVPFYRTPVDLIKQFIEFSPAAPILPSTRAALKAGRGPAMDTLAKMTLGTAAMIPLSIYAFEHEDNITLGAPRGEAARDAFYAAGKQPYSIKVGDTWYPYSRYSPFSEWFTTGALVAQAVRNDDEKTTADLAMDTFFGLTTNIVDKSFLTGLRDALAATSNPTGGRAQAFVNNLITGSFIPTISGRAAMSIDPTIREINNLGDAVQAKIPFLSRRLHARTDVFGEDLIRPSTGVVRFVSPVVPSTAKFNVVRHELEEIGYSLGFPSKTAFSEELDDDQYRELKVATGKITYNILFNVVTSPEYQKLTAIEKERAVDKVVREVREAVREKIAPEQMLMREIKNNLKGRGYSSAEADKIAPKIYESIKNK